MWADLIIMLIVLHVQVYKRCSGFRLAVYIKDP